MQYKKSQGDPTTESPNEFYSRMAEQIIDNKFSTRQNTFKNDVTELSRSNDNGGGPHLTPTLCERERSDGTMTKAYYQCRCIECKNGIKSNYTFFEYTLMKKIYHWLCRSYTGRK